MKDYSYRLEIATSNFVCLFSQSKIISTISFEGLFWYFCMSLKLFLEVNGLHRKS